MQYSAVRRVVFSQGYPFLYTFAARNFLPTHPLVHSPLWLEENDFVIVAATARLHGVRSPLQIDYYAHHPMLSPYASSGASHKPAVFDKAKAKHRVPICAATIIRFMYLYNFDQMTLECDYATDSLRDMGSVDASATTAAGGEDTHALSPSEAGDSASPHAMTAAMKAQSLSQARISRNDILRDVLQADYDDGQSMLSVKSGRPWIFSVQKELHREHAQGGYSSRWWGTVRQWKRVGLVPQPGRMPHKIAMPIWTKLIHISLVQDAATVLRRSYISSRSGTFTYYFDDMLNDSPNVGPLHAVISGDDGGPTTRLNAISDDYNDLLTASVEKQKRGDRARFARAIMADMAKNNYTIPLYFSSAHIQQANLSLRPDAVGVSFKEELVPRSTTNFSYLTDVQDSDTGNVFDAEYGGSVKDRIVRQNFMATPQYYYHLSQLSFPAGFTLPDEVIEAERRAPHEPRSGRTGAPLPHVELTANCLAHVYPELAAVLNAEVKPDTVPTDAPPDATAGAERGGGSGSSRVEADVERAHAADNSHLSGVGRALWFLPEDVIAFGGVVDVNAAPVEVTVTMNTTDADGMAQLSPGVVFNVACFVDMNAALRLINAVHGPGQSNNRNYQMN